MTRSCCRASSTSISWSAAAPAWSPMWSAPPSRPGARQEELLKARREHIDQGRRQMTLIGKGNRVRVITLDPYGGYDLLAAFRLSPISLSYSGTPTGRPIKISHPNSPLLSGAPPLGRATMASASVRSVSTTSAICMPCNGSRMVARSTTCRRASGTPASRPPKSI